MKNKIKHSIILGVTVSLWFIFWTTDASVNPALPELNLDSLYFKGFSVKDTIDDDTLKYPFEDYSNNPYENSDVTSPLELSKPSNITTEVEYDPETGNFIITEKIGDMNFRPPYVMTFDEYNAYKSKTELRSYWRQRLAYETDVDETGNNLLDDYLKKNLNVGIKGFDKIFGTNEINITPTGSATLTFGLKYYRQQNPMYSKNMQRNVNFEFDENIKMGVSGQIGDKMTIGINYDTEATFDFENQTSIEYVGNEDEIIQKIEAGDVAMPLNNTLISGSSTLFGFLTELKFGKLTVTAVASQQKGESDVIEVDGGAVVTDYEIKASDYEEGKHFFLSHYFRDNYEKSLQTLPLITSGYTITRIEVWITNSTSDYEDSRNIIAFLDLGEDTENIHADGFVYGSPETYPSNDMNNLYSIMTSTYSGIRDVTAVSSVLNPLNSAYGFVEGQDYVKLENARKLSTSEYTFNEDLGYLSLSSSVRDDAILAVAFEYTVGGQIYKVGEFSNGDVDAPNTIITKLLKGPSMTPALPNWDLMMKNVYSLGTWSVTSDDFEFEIVYNNDVLGTPTSFIPEGAISNQRLLSVMNLDNTDNQLNQFPDGYFDFIEGVTINSSNGRIYFPVLEPFGEYLRDKIDDEAIAEKYVFEELYDSTKYRAEQIAEKNKFYMKGSYKSSGGSQISLNSFNIPEGSVKVSAGAVQLTENVDYVVDYSLGRVTIINQTYLTPGTPIKISLESNSLFNIKTKNLVGSHFDYRVSDDFNIGSTIMNLTEKPPSNKVSFGDEPTSNTIWGLNTAYSKEAPFLTKAVDLLPFIETKEKSTINFTAEYAQLIPGNPRAIEKSGTSFIDDFEGSQTYMDMKSQQAWVLASTPQNQQSLFPEADSLTLAYGYNRAKFAWYTVTPDLQENNSTTPDHLTTEDLRNHLTRQVLEKEIFTNKTSANNIQARLSVLNVAFYPTERGPYNFDIEPSAVSSGIDLEGNLLDPETRWGGIMRQVTVSDFEASNVEFIEFWLMDPYVYDSLGTTSGELYFNLGDISEDVLKDGKKSYENGLPYPPDADMIDTTAWGVVSKKQQLTESFNTQDAAAMKIQDVGFDGLSDTDEQTFYSDYLRTIRTIFGANSSIYTNIANDPAGDNFHYFFGTDYDQQELSITDRYKKFNGIDGNSPTNENTTSTSTSISMYPDIEDVNNDHTMDVYENYFQYKVLIDPNEMVVGQNYITSIVEAPLSYTDGTKDTIRWYQFKIPINEPDAVMGNITDFKSIRFMRMFLAGFNQEIVLRFAKLDLVRSDWRKYQYNLTEGSEGSTYSETEEGTFDVSVVNIEESASKTPVNYVLPPGVSREYSAYDPQQRELNEQSVSLIVTDLPDGESKAIYKTLNMDLRKYKMLKMFIHAEALENDINPVDDDEIIIFVRMGSDFKENYYQYEIPVKITPSGRYIGYSDIDKDHPDEFIVWPEENNLDLVFEDFQDAKQQRNEAMREDGTSVRLNLPYIVNDGDNKIIVMGNPNLSNVKTIMIGIKNPNANNNTMDNDDGLPKSIEIWVNELRLTDFNEDGGWAANARLAADLADFGDVAVEGYTHTPGFGSIEQKVNDRYKDQVYEYYLSSNFELGKFFPQKFGVNIPLYFGFSESRTNPEFNPLDPDILLNTTLASDYYTAAEKDSIRFVSQEFVQRKNINLTNISISGNSEKTSTKTYPWDIDKWSSSFAYSEVFSRDANTEFDIEQNLTASLNYNYTTTPKNITPFKSKKIFGKSLPAIIKDFNFYYVPSLVAFSGLVNRQYSTHKTRDVSNSGIILPATFQKDFLWSRTYDLTHKLSKNLKVTFSAANSSRVDPQGLAESRGFLEKYGYQPQDTIFHELYNLGYNTDYVQDFDVAWTTPINKLPLLGWTSLIANYTATYDWIRGSDPVGIEDEETGEITTIDFGNSIQNSRNLKLTGRLTFTTLYNKVKYLKSVQTRFTEDGRTPVATKFKDVTYSTTVKLKAGISKSIMHNLKTETISEVTVTDASGNVVVGDFEVVDKNKIKYTSTTDVDNATVTVKGKREQNESILLIASDYTLFSLMAIQNVNITYQDNAGILMNGFSPDAKILGMQKINNMWAPGGKFIFGEQDPDFLFNSYRNNWLVSQTDTTNGYYNEPYNAIRDKDLSINATIEPINNFSIRLNFDRSIGFDETDYTGFDDGGNFEIQTQLISGSYSISYNTIKTAFWKIDTTDSKDYYSRAFSNMLANRNTIAQRMADERADIFPDYNSSPVPSETGPYYPDGYDRNSQDVVLSAFLAAYTGQSPEKIKLTAFPEIPLPDWYIKYEGLKNLPLIKDYVSSFVIEHNYMSTYTVSEFTSNPEFDFTEFENKGLSSSRYDATGMFIPQYEISSIRIDEKFNPLIGVDITWSGTLSTKLEFNKTRTMELSFNNNRIKEANSKEFVMGIGYKFAQLPINIKTGGEIKHFESDLVIRVDFTISENYTLYRRIEEQLSELESLLYNFTLTSTADYTLNERFNIQFYYNHSFNRTIVSYPITNMEFGFKVQFALIP